MKARAYTLTEVLMVVILLMILASITVPFYHKTVKTARDREASSMLRLIREAERIYRLENGAYLVCANTSACNTGLNLNLPTQTWSYSVSSSASDKFCAEATFNSDSWHITQSMDDPASGGCS